MYIEDNYSLTYSNQYGNRCHYNHPLKLFAFPEDRKNGVHVSQIYPKTIHPVAVYLIKCRTVQSILTPRMD